MRPLEEYMSSVSGADAEAREATRRLQDRLTKPQGSLGKLEDLSIRLAGAYGMPRPSIRGKTVFTMAADHGVTEEGVSAYPQEVTRQMVLNFSSGGAAINVLARHVGASVEVVDMGVATSEKWPSGIIDRKVGMGTMNMTKGPAMTVSQARTSLEVGAELAVNAIEGGANALAIGDMGIGNTTAASAITAVVSGRTPEEVTGRGTGIDNSRLRNKVSVIESALSVNSPDPCDGFDVLSKVGGFEIGGMAGVLIGAASARVPVFLDGFVSSSAALVASEICPKSVDFMVASHLSVEPGHEWALAHLGFAPVLDLKMRLGEGTGAVLAIDIADASCKILAEMATFDSAGVSGECEEG